MSTLDQILTSLDDDNDQQSRRDAEAIGRAWARLASIANTVAAETLALSQQLDGLRPTVFYQGPSGDTKAAAAHHDGKEVQ